MRGIDEAIPSLRLLRSLRSLAMTYSNYDTLFMKLCAKQYVILLYNRLVFIILYIPTVKSGITKINKNPQLELP